MQFEHEILAQRVIFATGRAAESVRAEVERLAASRLMIIAGGSARSTADRITADLGVVVRHDEVAMHVPVAVAGRARAVAREHAVDALISIGGGSTTGLAKAIALDTGLPIIAVPTTYAGSEATNVWGLTDDGRKSTGVDPRVLPRSIVYDADLTRSLPAALSVASGLNALAHGIDSMWGPQADPIDRTFAGEGIRALRIGLPGIVADPDDRSSRESTLYGAYAAAVAFASAGSGLHHKICHALGGAFNLPHAQTHAVVLPYVLALNAPSMPEAEQRIAAALDADSADAGLAALRTRLDAPRALRDYGLLESDLDRAVELILPTVPPNNPTPVDADRLRQLLQAAWAGADPQRNT